MTDSHGNRVAAVLTTAFRSHCVSCCRCAQKASTKVRHTHSPSHASSLSSHSCVIAPSTPARESAGRAAQLTPPLGVFLCLSASEVNTVLPSPLPNAPMRIQLISLVHKPLPRSSLVVPPSTSLPPPSRALPLRCFLLSSFLSRCFAMFLTRRSPHCRVRSLCAVRFVQHLSRDAYQQATQRIFNTNNEQHKLSRDTQLQATPAEREC